MGRQNYQTEEERKEAKRGSKRKRYPGNKDKMKEIRMILSDLGMPILSMKEAGIHVDVVEDGTTFEENALIKATEIANDLAATYTAHPRGYKLLGDIKVQRADQAEVATIAFDEYMKACNVIEASGNAAQYASDAKVVFNYLGNYYLEQNDVETAKIYFYKYLEIDPKNDAYRAFVEGLK